MADDARSPGQRPDEPRTPEPAGTHEAAERALRRALSAQADAVDPGPAPRVGDLAEDGTSRRRWPAAVAVAAGVAVLAAATTLAVRPDDAPPPVAAPTISTAPATTSPPAPSVAPSAGEPAVGPSAVEPGPSGSGQPTAPAPQPSVGPTQPSATQTGPGATQTVPPPAGTASTVLVWASVVEPRTQTGRLVPERRVVDLPAGAGTQERVQAALTLLTTSAPADPDFYSGWWWDAAETGTDAPSDGSDPVEVDVTADGTTVDLPVAATRAPLGSFGTLTAVDELVRTVVSNGGTAPVTVLVDGEVADLWGAVRLEGPVEADPDLLTGGWVLDPYEGQRVAAGTVTVSGTATAFEANVLWEVRDADGTVVADGFTMAGANGEYGPFTFTVDLGPGSYTVAVREPSVADSDEAPPLVWEDTTTFTVVG